MRRAVTKSLAGLYVAATGIQSPISPELEEGHITRYRGSTGEVRARPGKEIVRGGRKDRESGRNLEPSLPNSLPN